MNIASSDESVRAHDLIGHNLMGRYAVHERIARGGMAIVFKGEDERLHRPVAVKVFFGFDPAQPEYAVVLEHFVQEAFALSRLQHPATLRIYDFGYLDEEGRTGPFFVTEYADSGHLGELLADQGKLDPQTILRILHPLVGALREAHAVGIVHRDLKPSNILFTSAGGELSPKLADFSIAKAEGDLPHRASDTNAQAPLYSLSWAAPEQLADGTIGQAADVFALGLVTAYMFTGELIYPGEDLVQLYSLRSEGAPYRNRVIRELGLPAALERLILKACHEEPGRRSASVQEFYDALEVAFASIGKRRDPPPVSGQVSFDDEDTTERRLLVERDAPPRPEVTAPVTAPTSPSASPHAAGAAPYDSGSSTAAPSGPSPQANPSGPRPQAPSSGPLPQAPSSGPLPQAPSSGPLPQAHPPSAPQLLPPVSPPDPRTSVLAGKPRLHLSTLATPRVVVGNRRLQVLLASDTPLVLPGVMQGLPARLRVTPVEIGAGQAHLKGLNCFLRRVEGRPSSGLNVDRPARLELVDPRTDSRGELSVAIGTQRDGHHELELRDAIIVIPVSLARWAAVLETSAGLETVLLYLPAFARTLV